MPRGKGHAAAAAALVSALAAVPAARADVDMTGPWSAQVFIVFGPTLDCTIDFTQAGTDVTIAATCLVNISASGAIDPITGAFAAAGTGGGLCPTATITNGAANPDNKTFYMQLNCAGGPLPIVAGIYGYRCGNGQVDAIAGETCDDGNRFGGDCCGSSCVYDSPGHFCFDEGSQCTRDECDGAGTCLHIPDDSLPCSDYNVCTVDEHCEAGVCVTTPVPDGTSCDYFEDDCTDDACQAGTCVPVNKPDGAPCDDGLDCFVGESCSDGQCVTGSAKECATCQRCLPGYGCVNWEYAVLSCEAPLTDFIRLKDATRDSGKWKWTSPVPLTATDFGDPAGDTGYELCVFDSDRIDFETLDTPLLFGADIPGGAGWQTKASGFRFTSPDKSLKVRFKAGDAGKSGIQLSARGPDMVANLPPATYVTAYLRTKEGVSPERCFSSYWPVPMTSTAKKFVAKSPLP